MEVDLTLTCNLLLTSAGLVLCAAHLPVPPALRPPGLHAVVSLSWVLFSGRSGMEQVELACQPARIVVLPSCLPHAAA